MSLQQITANDILSLPANTVSNTQFTAGAVENYMTSTGVPFSYRNIIHNGEMLIDQHFNGANTVMTSSMAVDRWGGNCYSGTTANTLYSQQVVDAPTGFYNSLKITCTSGVATSSNANGRRNLSQYIEGVFSNHLNWGTTYARPITMSFWAKSSLTGAHAVSLQSNNQAYSYATTYTISTANTWQYFVLNIPAPPSASSGNWTANNIANILTFWDLGQGSSITASSSGQLNSWQAADLRGYANAVHIADTTGATWQITGVQMEPGTTATPFEHRPYSLEFAICQRYFEQSYDYGVLPGTATTAGQIGSSGIQGGNTTGEIDAGFNFKVTKRASPSLNYWDTAGNSGKCNRTQMGVSQTNNQSVATNYSGTNNVVVYSGSGVSAGQIYFHYTASAEI